MKYGVGVTIVQTGYIEDEADFEAVAQINIKITESISPENELKGNCQFLIDLYVELNMDSSGNLVLGFVEKHSDNRNYNNKKGLHTYKVQGRCRIAYSLTLR